MWVEEGGRIGKLGCHRVDAVRAPQRIGVQVHAWRLLQLNGASILGLLHISPALATTAHLLLGEVGAHLLQFFLLGANLVECLDLVLVLVVELLKLLLGLFLFIFLSLKSNLVLIPLRFLAIELFDFSLKLFRFLSQPL